MAQDSCVGHACDETANTIKDRDREGQRERPFCARRPDLAGFDPFAIEVESLAALHALAARCDELGVEHRGVLDHTASTAPTSTSTTRTAPCCDSSRNNVISPRTFHGFEFEPDQQVTVYNALRLHMSP
jgi:hypothetical protein